MNGGGRPEDKSWGLRRSGLGARSLHLFPVFLQNPEVIYQESE